MPFSFFRYNPARAIGRAKNPELALHCVLLKCNFQVLFFLIMTDLHPKAGYYEYA